PLTAPHSPEHRDASSLFGGDGVAPNGNVDFGEFGVCVAFNFQLIMFLTLRYRLSTHPVSPSKQPHPHLPTEPVPQGASTTLPSQTHQDFQSLQRRHSLLSSELTDLRTELNHSRAPETHIRGAMRALEDELTGLHEVAQNSNHLEAQYGELHEQNASLQPAHDHLQRAHDGLKKQGDDLLIPT
ncbi:MAG TPA: hypothetical protein VGO47_10130, partial [Chlamydiales bacterium]|nr:hypothetical protein [Chlamydiales bacterium]